jgi:predicted DNA-binding WGR domain protein
MLVTLYKTDSAGSLHYYSVHNRQGSLFTNYTLTVSWGSAPSAGREKLFLFESKPEQDEKLRELVQRKLAEGYRVLYSYFRNSEYETLGKAFQSA